jgi:L-alanine-DL-glutamate epimerase-like enolase superfamily enzyme
MSTYDAVKDMPLEIESLELEGCELVYSPEFTRLTTLVRLRGGGEEGVGEDVTYAGLDQVALQSEGKDLDLPGSYTVDSFSEKLEEVGLWRSPPSSEQFRPYRTWAFESAALDLALRQAGKSLAEAVEREAQPLNFVVSMRLGAFDTDEPENADRLKRLLERYPDTRFKLDPGNTWTQQLVDELAATEAVDVFDLKGFYRGTPVDVETDPELYRMVAEAVPSAWLEDADVTDETLPVLEPIHDRLTWDAPIHSVQDVLDLRWKPRMINIKPSRFGTIERLFDTYDHCEREAIGCYGGGQSELAEGRGQIQYLASLFHADNPNDTAPAPYNNPDLGEGLPTSPLPPNYSETGFRRLED